MKIALDVQSTLGQKTGIGHYTANLLAALPQADPQNTYVPLDWSHAPAMRIDRRLFWQQIALPRRARGARAHVLHVTGFDAPRFKPCPVVLTVHDLIGALFPQQFPPAARWYWGHWLPRSVRWADAIIADSECTRCDLQRLAGIAPERVTVVPLGVDRRYRHPQAAAAMRRVCQQYRLPEQFVLYIGTLEPRKGLDTLVEAFVRLAGRLPHDLVIVGKEGWATAPLFQQVETLGLAARIHFTGYVADEDLPALYASASVFAFPSRYEGFGLPPLEAMACGTPVVCSNASSLPEVVGDAGLLVPPDAPTALANALEQVLVSPELHAALKERGHQQAGRFTWEETARRTLAVYESLARPLPA
ncbi:MAG: glycosyltransferase family 4 protein [Chloroflexota bacterium]